MTSVCIGGDLTAHANVSVLAVMLQVKWSSGHTCKLQFCVAEMLINVMLSYEKHWVIVRCHSEGLHIGWETFKCGRMQLLICCAVDVDTVEQVAVIE